MRHSHFRLDTLVEAPGPCRGWTSHVDPCAGPGELGLHPGPCRTRPFRQLHGRTPPPGRVGSPARPRPPGWLSLATRPQQPRAPWSPLPARLQVGCGGPDVPALGAGPEGPPPPMSQKSLCAHVRGSAWGHRGGSETEPDPALLPPDTDRPGLCLLPPSKQRSKGFQQKRGQTPLDPRPPPHSACTHTCAHTLHMRTHLHTRTHVHARTRKALEPKGIPLQEAGPRAEPGSRPPHCRPAPRLPPAPIWSSALPACIHSPNTCREPARARHHMGTPRPSLTPTS